MAPWQQYGTQSCMPVRDTRIRPGCSIRLDEKVRETPMRSRWANDPRVPSPDALLVQWPPRLGAAFAYNLQHGLGTFRIATADHPPTAKSASLPISRANPSARGSALNVRFPRFQRDPLLRFSSVYWQVPVQVQLEMQFEVLATCNTTRARVSRMKLPRELKGAKLRLYSSC